ncbi:Peptidyl-prolyl cis-trans isomerase [Roseomonas mucosa]|uniref:Parvulin-like PPIase n=1 Tax=Roseomonas mucosa TaxID=207340 RepID=A0A379MX49_9PROT|nr:MULTISPECIES: peptidylprolyl isomerase [Roseomonas]MBS5904362.1 peptidylprolyl isomerase [Acetobacteraceae bacterium]ATR19723.1 peptidylprolyl isomerase [Roseomonas sp. FDAARGOS_362]AWV23874.1 Peptidyl-prolyl cis-trans isomerase [Roseomonas mucosa]MCG7351347.1 peptidylprolyl isomerase [Roseomonas mucosa]MCG7356853.1 peptidylprolyl isomerase [Roseomonas mucosa]
MRFPVLILSLGLLSGPLADAALAQTSAVPNPTAAPASPQAAQQPADPVVARVNGEEIRLSDVRDAAQDLPAEARNAPPQVLFPLIVDQLIAQKAVAAAARAQGLEKDPEVQHRIAVATDQELQQALIRRDVAPALTDEALRKRFEAEQKSQPAEEEVHARHILVASKEEADKVLAEVRKPGADFAAIAQKYSTDPSGKGNGGDLGFFKKSDMVPEFAEAAFALKPGQISPAPVKSAFGWHIIKVEERRAAPPKSFEEQRASLRQAAFEEAVNAALEKYKAGAKVERFNLDGTPQRQPSPLDGATPPAPAQKN